jgi:hypothetical protein
MEGHLRMWCTYKRQGGRRMRTARLSNKQQHRIWRCNIYIQSAED